MKLPAIQFYPGDWLRDNVSGCSLAAQGLWLRLMILGHDSERYGYLMQNGVPIPPESIARRCGCTLEQYTTLLHELEHAGVPSRTPEGVIFSRRMVRDSDDRAKNATRQQRFRDRNSNACRNGERNATVTPMSHRSSSSSSSSSSKRRKNTSRDAPRSGSSSEDPVRNPQTKARKPSPIFGESKAYWMKQWAAKYGRDYYFGGAKDAVALNKIIAFAKEDIDAVMWIIDGYLSDDDPFHVKLSHPLTSLASQINTYGAAIPPPPKEFTVEEMRAM